MFVQWKIVAKILGAILLLASGAKFFELFGGSEVAVTSIERIFWVLTASIQALFGTYLLFDKGHESGWWCSLCLWCVFIAYTAVASWRHHASCHCFGPVKTPPVLTLVFDIVALAFIVAARKSLLSSKNHRVSEPLFFPSLITAMIICCLCSFKVLSRGHIIEYPTRGVVILDKSQMLLQPNQWKDLEFPLLNYIDIGPDLTSGDWEVILFRRDCETCKDEVPKLMRKISKEDGSTVTAKAAFVEIPPFAPSSPPLIHSNSPRVVIGTLDAAFHWEVRTPTIVKLHNGRVIGNEMEKVAVSDDQNAKMAH